MKYFDLFSNSISSVFPFGSTLKLHSEIISIYAHFEVFLDISMPHLFVYDFLEPIEAQIL